MGNEDDYEALIGATEEEIYECGSPEEIELWKLHNTPILHTTILKLESEDREAIACAVDMVKLSLVVQKGIVKVEVKNED